ncbi:MAG: large-conductance mechanosensitive channel protein MscL [Planctomycetes bacterium]|nr:large-conductance mechanosensitive channel protein MscL [Planctomycetota bacterium]MCA8936010.1 large-conductance mechanosensitive channel protein MscL [Planctomycetota bacterium]MCA8945930.1 large-conductance mechanosensitive channel protein MscL [Planctomycetota bacterium]
MGIIKEFRDFAVKGNVIDMAVGIVIGTAFTAIVQSLVKDIIMPPIGYVLGNIDFKDLAINMGTEAAPVTINYGAFINVLINFIIVAFAMFVVVKTINKLKKKQAAAPAKPTKDQELLTEIRDLLQAKPNASDEQA